MLEIDWNRCATTPREHQKDGVRALLARPFFMLADEVGGGKSKQIVDTAQVLYEGSVIDTVVALAPAMCLGMWSHTDPTLGEVAKHGWPSIKNHIVLYSIKNQRFPSPVPNDCLLWVAANYEFVRREERLLPLLKFLVNRKFWLVCDEAWALKDQGTAQWRASFEIRKLASRITLLNGTPIADSPMDLNAQMRLLDQNILGFPYVTRGGKRCVSNADSRFRHYYAGLAPNPTPEQMTMWRKVPIEQQWPRLEELRLKVAPYVIRRKTRDCFDLPPILPPITIEAKLTDPTWKIYRQMRDDMVAWLSNDTASVAKQAMVKGLRLSQITSGFLGGVSKMDLSDFEIFEGAVPAHEYMGPALKTIQEIGREKLDATLDWLSELRPQPDRLLIWCRFRAEIERTARAFSSLSPELHLARRAHMLYGEQPPEDRQAAIAALNPSVDPEEPVVMVGHPAAGGAGLNLAGASLAITLSQDFSLRVSLQKNGRIDRLGQKQPIRYVDVVAVGPKGQRTIDHHVVQALRSKEDIANWTTATWRKKLLDE